MSQLQTLDGRPMTWDELHQKVDDYYTHPPPAERLRPGEVWDALVALGGRATTREVADRLGIHLIRAYSALRYIAIRDGYREEPGRPPLRVWRLPEVAS